MLIHRPANQAWSANKAEVDRLKQAQMHEVAVIKGHLGKAQQPCTLLLQSLAGLHHITTTSHCAPHVVSLAIHSCTVVCPRTALHDLFHSNSAFSEISWALSVAPLMSPKDTNRK